MKLIQVKSTVKGVKRVKGYAVYLVGEWETSDRFHVYGSPETDFEQFKVTRDDIKREWDESEVKVVIAEDEPFLVTKKDDGYVEITTGIEVDTFNMIIVENSCMPLYRRLIYKKSMLSGKKMKSSDLIIKQSGSGFVVVGKDEDFSRKKHCKCCGELLDEDKFSLGQDVCDKCFEEKYATCKHCGKSFEKGTMHSHDGELYCNTCWDECNKPCANCGVRVFGEVKKYPDGGGSHYCPKCFDKKLEKPIQNYSFKPDPEFHGDDKLQFGVELEVQCDDNTDNGDVAKKVRDNSGGIHGLFYMKSDGSIGYGFEMVSHPFSHQWMIDNKDFFRDHLKLMRDLKCKSSEQGVTSCGMHIHVSKDAWKDTQLLKLMKLFYGSEDAMANFSRRKRSKLDQWASLTPDSITSRFKDPRAMKKLVKEKKSGSIERAALHFTQNTMEFRLFNSTLDPDTFMSNVEIIKAMFDFTSEVNIRKCTFKNFLLYVNKYQSRYEYLYQRLEGQCKALDSIDAVREILGDISDDKLKETLKSLLSLV